MQREPCPCYDDDDYADDDDDKEEEEDHGDGDADIVEIVAKAAIRLDMTNFLGTDDENKVGGTELAWQLQGHTKAWRNLEQEEQYG